MFWIGVTLLGWVCCLSRDCMIFCIVERLTSIGASELFAEGFTVRLSSSITSSGLSDVGGGEVDLCFACLVSLGVWGELSVVVWSVL